jgi:menaquinone-dependent protoporphyrinogen oxidase
MRVLVTWGSKRGGTEGIARIIGVTLQAAGFDVMLRQPREALEARGFDAAIVGGALYAGRWHREARAFVRRRRKELRRVPVWFFSSGPLDDSSERGVIPPTPQVLTLMEQTGALGHMTFGGRLLPDAHGFPASAMARKHSGDWRNQGSVRGWAADVARALPSARPGPVIVQPGGSLVRLLAHAVMGWAACALATAAIAAVAGTGVALAIDAVLAPAVFFLVARHYFHPRGARGAVVTAITFATTMLLFNLVAMSLLPRRGVALVSLVGLWLPALLIFAVTWAMGEIVWMVPPPRALPSATLETREAR